MIGVSINIFESRRVGTRIKAARGIRAGAFCASHNHNSRGHNKFKTIVYFFPRTGSIKLFYISYAGGIRRCETQFLLRIPGADSRRSFEARSRRECGRIRFDCFLFSFYFRSSIGRIVSGHQLRFVPRFCR